MTDHLTGFFPAGRDRGVTVAVEGFFAFVWFGWGQAAPPSWLVVPLAVGGGLAVLLTVAGVVLTTRSAGRLRVMADPAVRRRYSIIVGLEFGLLGRRRGRARNDRAAPVDPGVDLRRRRRAFLPARLDPGEPVVAAARRAADRGGRGGPGDRAGIRDGPSTVTGAGAGLCLLAFGLVTLLARRPLHRDPCDGLRVASISTRRDEA